MTKAATTKKPPKFTSVDWLEGLRIWLAHETGSFEKRNDEQWVHAYERMSAALLGKLSTKKPALRDVTQFVRRGEAVAAHDGARAFLRNVRRHLGWPEGATVGTQRPLRMVNYRGRFVDELQPLVDLRIWVRSVEDKLAKGEKSSWAKLHSLLDNSTSVTWPRVERWIKSAKAKGGASRAFAARVDDFIQGKAASAPTAPAARKISFRGQLVDEATALQEVRGWLLNAGDGQPGKGEKPERDKLQAILKGPRASLESVTRWAWSPRSPGPGQRFVDRARLFLKQGRA